MKFESISEKEYQEIRQRRHGRAVNKDVLSLLNEFMNCEDVKVVRVEFTQNEYKSAKCAYQSFRRCANANNIPVRLFIRDKKLYMMKELEVDMVNI